MNSNDKGKSDFYETFDSGGGPLIPDGAKGDFAHQDSGAGLSEDGQTEHGAVPEVPSKKK